MPVLRRAGEPRGERRHARGSGAAGRKSPILIFLPLVSLVLYFIWKGDKPKVAKGMGQFTLIGLAVGAGLALIIVIIIGVLFAITASMTVFEMIRSFFNGSLNGINDLINNIPFIG